MSGRKRHIVVDTLGLLLVIHIQPGQLQERLGAAQVFATAGQQAPTLRLVWADGSYSGPLVAGDATATDCRVEIVVKPAEPTKKVLSSCPNDGSWNAPSGGSASIID